MAMAVVDDSCLQADSQPKSGGLVWGSTAAWRCSAIHQMNRVNSRNGLWSWWQHYKYRPSIIIIIITTVAAQKCGRQKSDPWPVDRKSGALILHHHHHLDICNASITVKNTAQSGNKWRRMENQTKVYLDKGQYAGEYLCVYLTLPRSQCWAVTHFPHKVR